jgi:hypothetical protein
VFQKSYTGNILGIGRNKFQKSYFSRKLPEDRKRAGEGPHHLGVRRPWQPPDDTPSPIRSLGTENPKGIGNFPETVS